MPPQKINLLLVDDDIHLRLSLSAIFTHLGYRVRSAEDGFAALVAIRAEIPDLLLSDLFMPGMSGFELLSVVRRRLPALRVLAMSSAFSGRNIPAGLAADAFYEKASNLPLLLETVKRLTQAAPMPSSTHAGPAPPMWIPQNGHDPTGAPFVMIACPECLRIFPQVFARSEGVSRVADCVHCGANIQYAIDRTNERAPALTTLSKHDTEAVLPSPAPSIH